MSGELARKYDGAFRAVVWGGAALLLSLPLIAMQFTTEVNWTGFDFAVFGAVLLLACSAFELGVRASTDLVYRAGYGLAIAAAFGLVWVNLAVGFIGDTEDPANLMFAGVIGVSIIGSIVARLRPGGMARTMLATAVAMGLAGVLAVTAFEAPNSPAAVLLGATGVFVAMWLVSAWLFNGAAQRAA